MIRSNCQASVVKVLLVALLVHHLAASTLTDILQDAPNTQERECYCKCTCNEITSTTTTLPPRINLCAPDLTGWYPHPDDRCKKYVYCSHGTERFTPMFCPPGQFFTPGNDRCTSDVPEGCDTPDTTVVLFESAKLLGPSESVDLKWGECYNLEEIDMASRISSIRFWRNDCVYLCDTNQCDGNCIVLKAGDIRLCDNNLANCAFDKRAKSMRSCSYYGDN